MHTPRPIPSFIAVATALLACFFLASGCAYQLGSVSGKEIAGVKSVFVPIIKNETYEPAISAMMTDSIIQRFHSDGRLEVSRERDADSVLHVKLVDMKRSPLRSSRGDTHVVAEYRLQITAQISYSKTGHSKPVIDKELISADTEFFIGLNLQEGERQALGLVSDRLAKRIVERITEGW